MFSNVEREFETRVFLELDKLLVYGAGARAIKLLEYLHWLCPGKVIGCAVSKGRIGDYYISENVYEIEYFEPILDKNNVGVIIACNKENYGEIRDSLAEKGFKNILFFDDEFESGLTRILDTGEKTKEEIYCMVKRKYIKDKLKELLHEN